MPMTHKERTLRFLRPEMETVFSLEEYAGRLERVKAGMAGAGLDMLYLTSPEAICYLSGFRSEWYQAQGPKSWLPVSGLAICVRADDYIHFEVQNERVLAGFTSVSRDLRIFDDDSQPGGGLLEFIVDELDAEGWLRDATVGFEIFGYRPKRGVSEMLQAAMEARGARVVDGTDVVGEARRIKSPQEIAYTRTAARIGDIGMKAALDAIRPGVSELDVYGETVRAMARAGGENPSIVMPVSSGAKSSCMHALASGRKIAPGDVVNVDLCGVYNRYHANMARTICVGEPHAEVSRYLDAIAGVKAVLEGALRPNLPVRELLRTVEAYYRDAGIWRDRCWVGGYDLGISFPPDWVGPWFYDVHTDSGDETFEPGMTTNYEANFYLPHLAGMSMFIDTMVFTEDSAEFLQRTPARLPVVE